MRCCSDTLSGMSSIAIPGYIFFRTSLASTGPPCILQCRYDLWGKRGRCDRERWEIKSFEMFLNQGDSQGSIDLLHRPCNPQFYFFDCWMYRNHAKWSLQVRISNSMLSDLLLSGPFAQDFHGTWWLVNCECSNSCLINPTLVPCNALQRIPQNSNMIYPQTRHPSTRRPRHNVRRIIFPTNPNLHNRRVNLS